MEQAPRQQQHNQSLPSLTQEEVQRLKATGFNIVATGWRTVFNGCTEETLPTVWLDVSSRTDLIDTVARLQGRSHSCMHASWQFAPQRVFLCCTIGEHEQASSPCSFGVLFELFLYRRHLQSIARVRKLLLILTSSQSQQDNDGSTLLLLLPIPHGMEQWLARWSPPRH
jgi:hypothetical protein